MSRTHRRDRHDHAPDQLAATPLLGEQAAYVDKAVERTGAHRTVDQRSGGGEHAPTPERPTAPLPPHVTTPLLTLLTQQSMDEDYRAVAERRKARAAAGEESHQDRRSSLVTVAAVAVFGVLVSIAFAQTSRNADVEALGRESLAERITQEKAAVTRLQDQSGELLDANAEAEAELRELREREEQVTSRVARLGARTGYLAVRGPGLRITVDDAPDTVVQDEDLHILVDGLWSAGAEAIAINGQRLTVLSPVQNSGGAIHVNVRPLKPPYVVEAIGDPERMPGQLLASTNGSLFYSVARSLGFEFSVEDDVTLELPAARVRPLRSAEIGTARDRGDQQKEDSSP